MFKACCAICVLLKIIHILNSKLSENSEFIKTSTGYGYTKQADGSYNYKGATEADVRLMRKYAAPAVQVKAAGGIRTLEELLKMKALGVTRIGATATVPMLEEAKKRLGLAVGKVVMAPTDGY